MPYKESFLTLKEIHKVLFGPNGVCTKYFKKHGEPGKKQKNETKKTPPTENKKENKKGGKENAALQN
jgi:hypothetical protein